ncbi:hypothetical protein RJ640_022500, partial [Escallonia rubra]
GELLAASYLIDMVPAVLFLLLGLPILLLFLVPRCRTTGGTRSAPGPPGLPFIGNLHQLDNSALHRQLWQLSKKYGPIMSLRLGLVPTLVISSAGMAKEVFKTNDLAFSGRPTFLGQQKLSYNGLDMAFSPYNDSWRELRRVFVLYLFSSKRAQSFRPIRQEEVSRMVNKISKLATSSKLANLSEILATLMSNIICGIAFGKQYDDDGRETHWFHRLIREIDSPEVIIGYKRISRKWISCTKNSSTSTSIQEGQSPHRRTSLISCYNLGRTSYLHLISLWITLKGCSCLIRVLLSFDATETITATVVWAVTELVRNPPVMKKAQKEGASVEEDDLEKLPYLKAVLKETMRLHPAGPLLLPRETTQSCVINGYEIQPKTLVFGNAWAIGKDPEALENPEKFLPERFLGDSTIDFKRHHFELLPFGVGRRGCPGMSMGATIVELALANLLQAFDWELPVGIDKEDIAIEGKSGLVVHPKHDLSLVPNAFAKHVAY